MTQKEYEEEMPRVFYGDPKGFIRTMKQEGGSRRNDALGAGLDGSDASKYGDVMIFLQDSGDGEIEWMAAFYRGCGSTLTEGIGACRSRDGTGSLFFYITVLNSLVCVEPSGRKRIVSVPGSAEPEKTMIRYFITRDRLMEAPFPKSRGR